MSRNNKNNYIDDFVDLQENEYNYDWKLKQPTWEAGHNCRYPRLQAWFYIVDGVLSLLVLALLTWRITLDMINQEKDSLDIFIMIIIALIGVLFLFICVRFIRRGIRQLREVKRIITSKKIALSLKHHRR